MTTIDYDAFLKRYEYAIVAALFTERLSSDFHVDWRVVHAGRDYKERCKITASSEIGTVTGIGDTWDEAVVNINESIKAFEQTHSVATEREI